MTATLNALALAGSLFVLTGCTSGPRSEERSRRAGISDSPGVLELRWLDSADPERDVAAAVARGDTRFVGVYGEGRITPDVDPSAAARHGVRYLQGTADVIQGDEHGRLNRVAYSYAERYNKLLRQRLRR